MSDTFSVFRGTTSASSPWLTTPGGNYLFITSGTHASGTTKVEVAIPGTTPLEFSPVIDFPSSDMTTSGIIGLTLARGVQYRVSSIPGTSTTRVVFCALAYTGIGNA